MLTRPFNAIVPVGVVPAMMRCQARGRSRAALLVAALCLLPGCGAGGPSRDQGQDSTGKSSLASRTQYPTGEASGPNRCALLTDDEVRDAIGPHRAGIRDVSQLTGTSVVNSRWGFHSCRWTATTAQKIQGFPNGWFDAIEVRVFDKESESWARAQAKGEPVKGFLEGALYDRSYGKLWFNCGRGQFCVVEADTAAGEKREQVARQLAQLVENRLR